MLLYFITCVSFFLFLKPLLSLKPLPSWASEVRLISLSLESISQLFRNQFLVGLLYQIHTRMSLGKKTLHSSKVENVEDTQDMSVLDLPELVLECILERLPPDSLCQMAGVCRSLRERCVSDYLWERHMKQKWGRVIGPVAFREWKWHVASKRSVGSARHGKQRNFMRLVSFSWPFSWMRVKVDANNSIKQFSSLPNDSVMAWYLALESGNFWFPAQVYNRENGHVGFMLSCYDAELSYDPHTDTFQARYPPHGRRAVSIEHGIPWERLRAPPVDTPPHDLHISDCLNDLRPSDHIEIQWRRNKEFPYGWWYGVVGHLESCDGNENYCLCKSSDTVVLEFNQYTSDSRWRRTSISRKDHREEGNEADGFYGGIRKIENEISIWKHLWPSEVLD
ncbi:PREDICTED: F-box protein At2g32560-like isoform X2 [Lupinus angustifolius]|uniref:F-box protein At2g32560-like isoform X1 n=1 Tax=Lupinus angustifolius TaxID=3871 RepID=UPI00092EFB2C|nr:PREDICTED: F-box protein At2g32560-like isoform X1 [Lupinus angustifolius]XP_019434672.1 PREDICTED: F-box protein At2g32560-like isoform X1 [Lupinus angustifolius]XP_019434680.1 PREDICTED: F-box protein At2g32560-like isoform X2 [Lupinus angustifolius]